MQRVPSLKMQSILDNFMKVLITGINGQLGWELQQTLPDRFQLAPFDHTQLDITDASSVDQVVRDVKPDLIINTAAYTAVDKAENEAEKAYAVNAQGAATIARAAENANAHLLHISTDFVFEGTRYEPGEAGTG